MLCTCITVSESIKEVNNQWLHYEYRYKCYSDTIHVHNTTSIRALNKNGANGRGPQSLLITQTFHFGKKDAQHNVKQVKY